MVKFLRVLLCVTSITSLAVGNFLISASDDSLSWANGTAEAKVSWGWWIFGISLFVFIENTILGALRFYDRIHREGKDLWPKKRIVKRIVSSAIWKPLLLAPVVLIAFVLIAPKVSDQISAATLEDKYSSYDPTSDLDIDSSNSEVVLENLLLTNITFGTDASSNISANLTLPWEQNASAIATGKDVRKVINKAKLSSSGNFLILYTDTGSDKISDAEAEKLGSMLEGIIKKYKTNLGLDYTYKNSYKTFPSDRTKFYEMLDNNGLPSNILETAMPIYVINPIVNGETNVVARYTGADNLLVDAVALNIVAVLSSEDTPENIAAKENMSTLTTMPSLPMINIPPQNMSSPSLEIITAHEVGHHYAHEYALAHSASSPKTFITESIANYFSTKAVLDQPPVTSQATANEIARHHNGYLKSSTCYTIDKVIFNPPANDNCQGNYTIDTTIGYPVFSFLINYSEIVPDGQNKILNSIMEADPLTYLASQAGPSKMREVMKAQTERNLLNNYSQNNLTAYRQPRGETIPCKDFCEQGYTIHPVSSRYFYFTRQEYNSKLIKFSGKDLDFSLLAKNGTTWELIDSQKDQNEFTISRDDEHYLFAMAISNPLQEELDYTLEITDAEAESLLDSDATKSGLDLSQLSALNNLEALKDTDFASLNGNCATIHIDSMLDLSMMLIRGIGELGSSLIELTGESTAELNQTIADYETQTAEVKANLQYHYLNICQNTFKSNVSFDTALNFARKNLSSHLTLAESTDGDSKIGVYLSYNIWNGQSKIYIVVKDPEIPTSLYTISVN